MHRQQFQEHPDLRAEKRRNPHPDADRFRPSTDERLPGHLGAHDTDDGDQGRWVPLGQQMEQPGAKSPRLPFAEEPQALILRVQLLDRRQIRDGELADSHDPIPIRRHTLTATLWAAALEL